jgi:hypothetical protein
LGLNMVKRDINKSQDWQTVVDELERANTEVLFKLGESMLALEIQADKNKRLETRIKELEHKEQ